MRYLSVCSGIEAATVAWHGLGWEPAAFSEIERFPSDVLKYHYPNVPNVGDMTLYKEWNIGSIGLLVGGTPCQSFSVAGLRKGLDDPRGNLALVYCGLLDHLRPRWFVWENVPGVLSSNGGRDFGSILGALGKLGYGFAYRVLDAQYFGLAQRRKRVFVVGHLGDWRRAAAVLFEPESVRRDSPPRRETGARTAGGSACRAGGDGENVVQVVRAWTGDGCVADPISANEHKTYTHEGNNFRLHNVVQVAGRLRRLTPLEVERAQGFPIGYSAVPWRGRSGAECPDKPRTRALGNSMAVPVMRWVGERIALVDAIPVGEATNP